MVLDETLWELEMMREIQEADAVSIRDFFADLEDPRSEVNRRHLLEDVVVICILAVLAGTDGPKAIAIWAAAQKEWLGRRLELPHGVPSHDTLGRVLALLRPEAFRIVSSSGLPLFEASRMGTMMSPRLSRSTE